MTLLGSQPAGILRFALRAPLYLYRYELGWLLGHRFLMLTHRGRNSGLIRRTVLEVILYEPATRQSVVVSGWGRRSDWYRNIQTEPALEVETGRERYAPVQRFLGPEEAYEVITEYAVRHPLAVRLVAALFGYRITRSGSDRRAFVDACPLVAFRPEPSFTYPGSPG